MLLLSEKWKESVLQLISLRPCQSSIYPLFACFLACNSRTLSFIIRFLVNLLCPVQTIKSEEASNSKKMCSRCGVYVIHVWKCAVGVVYMSFMYMYYMCGKFSVYDDMIVTSSKKVYMTVCYACKNERNGLHKKQLISTN